MEQPFPEVSQSSEDQLIRIMSVNRVDFKVHEHERVTTLEDVEKKLGFDNDKLVKTLVFKVDNALVLVALKGKDQLDYKSLALALSARRSGIIKPQDEEIRQKLGYEIGGIAPVHFNSNIRMIFDQNILGLDRIYCGIGVNNKTLEVKTQQLIKVFKPKIASVARINK